MHGSRRVIIFCLLTTVLPTILIVLPVYLRNTRYADVMYKISDSDVIQIHKGQSSIFCQKHSIRMNSTFNAFQMTGTPVLSNKRKHIRLKKSMTIPDDTLEFWGFYLFKGAKVQLTACSRHEGSKILVVKGERILDTCGILDDKYRKNPQLVENIGHISVTVETPGVKRNKTKTQVSVKVATVVDRGSNLIDEEKGLLEARGIIQSSINKHSNLNSSHVQNSSLNEIKQMKDKNTRQRRDIHKVHNPNTMLDAGVHHGGNAFNFTAAEDASVSSFENSLHECYNGNIVINEYIPYHKCYSPNYTEATTIMNLTHEVLLDGYYYYIFYSDNDIVQNDIHVIFDIYKPTFQYTNMSDSKVCLNQTKCEFDVGFFSDELVIVEIPTRDGISYDEDDSSILVSVCHPRVSVYIFFPVTVLLLILLFAFL